MKPKTSAKNGKRSKSTSASSSNNLSAPTEVIDLTFGRHAVLAVLKGDRQINRIWLTEKLMAHGQFYPLIKAAKTNIHAPALITGALPNLSSKIPVSTEKKNIPKVWLDKTAPIFVKL